MNHQAQELAEVVRVQVTEKMAKANSETKDRYESLKAFAEALGDDVQIKTLKHYIAFKRIKNFASVEIHPQDKKIIVLVKADLLETYISKKGPPEMYVR